MKHYHRLPEKNMLNKAHRKGTPQQSDENNNQNIEFTEEALNNENKKSGKTHHKKKISDCYWRHHGQQ